jgi:hypothetical protein
VFPGESPAILLLYIATHSDTIALSLQPATPICFNTVE